MSETPKFTPGPWEICWSTYNGRRCKFEITASPHGSVRPLADTRWKSDLSEAESEELVANAHLMVAAPELYEALRAALVRLHEMDSAHQKEAERMECGYTGLPEVRLAEAALSKAEGRS